MKKPTKRPVTKKPQPSFEPGLQVLAPSLAIDQNGIAWWIDPFNRAIDKAEH